MVDAPKVELSTRNVVAFGLMWGVFAVMADSETYGDLGAALAGAVAVSVALAYGPQFVAEVKRMVE